MADEEVATAEETVAAEREPTLGSRTVDQGAALAEAAAEAGFDVTGGEDEPPAGPVGIAGAADFLDQVTGGGGPTSKLDAIDGSGGPDDVDLLDEMGTDVGALTGGARAAREALYDGVADGLTADDGDHPGSITGQGTGAISDQVGGLTTPRVGYEEGEGVRWSGKARTPEGKDAGMMSGLIGANLRLGQQMIDEAEGKGGSAPAPDAPPRTITEVRNGNTHTTHPDGTKTTYIGADGTEIIKSPDGTLEIRRADGTRTVQKPDGTIIDYGKDGKATTTPPPSTPNEEAPVHFDLGAVTEGALADQFAQLKGGGSGDVDPVDDPVGIDYGEDAARYRKDDLLGGDTVDEIRDGTRTGGGYDDWNGNRGAIDPGPDAVGAGGTGPEDDKLEGTRLDDDAAPTVGIPGAGASLDDEVDVVLEPVTTDAAEAADEVELAITPDEPVQPIRSFRAIETDLSGPDVPDLPDLGG